MQVSKKLALQQQQQTQHQGTVHKSPSLSPSPSPSPTFQKGQPHQRCNSMMMMKSNAVAVLIVLSFIVATSLLQLPTMDYIKFLNTSSSSMDGGGGVATEETTSPSIDTNPDITSTTSDTTDNDSGGSTDTNDNNNNNVIDDDNEEDDDENDSSDSSNDSNETPAEKTKEKSDGRNKKSVDDDDFDDDDSDQPEENSDRGAPNDMETDETNNADETTAKEDDDVVESNKTTKNEKEDAATQKQPDEMNHDEKVDGTDEDAASNGIDTPPTVDDDEKKDEFLPIDTNKEDSGKQQQTLSDNDEPQWEHDLSPKIVWLASYPNSGTSYTMTLVERASNYSTATNYGNEVTHRNYDSIPIYPNHDEGPFWEGMGAHAMELNRVIRSLPPSYILTKTHCGGRCIKCPASEYIVNTTRQFIYGCQKTSYRKNAQMITTEYGAPMSTIKKILHLIRNPYHNVVARFHLERKNMIGKDASYESQFTYDAFGFHNYCHYLDTNYNSEDEQLLPRKLYQLYFDRTSSTFIPCAAEFYKWVQWHNYVIQSSTLLGLPSDRSEHVDIEMMDQRDDDNDTSKKKKEKKTTTTASKEPSIPVHVIWYENYELDFNTTFVSIMEFLQLPIATEQIRTFRSLPTYDDHYDRKQRQNIKGLVQSVALPSTWKLIQHYF